MPSESCIDLDIDFDGVVEGEVVKVLEISFLGDVDRGRGVIVSSDSGCTGCDIRGKILVVEKFRGSTVGAYVLYSMCRRGVGPRAIVCIDPDPVIVAGAALCGIPIVYGLPKHFLQLISTGDTIRIEKRGAAVCVAIRKGF